MLLKILYRHKLTYFFLAYLLIVFLWWIKILLTGQTEGIENYSFNITYGLIALIGSVVGIFIAYKKWGGHKSVIGKGLIFLSIGLFGEWFGNAVWGYANIILHTEVPYPGFADIGFFSIIPMYAFAMFHFAKASGIKFSLFTLSSRSQVAIIPLIMIMISWALFLKDIPFDLSDPLKLFLDYGYPFGEAITVSIALLTYSLSSKILGGKMRTRILFIIFALIMQYFTDYLFLYRTGLGVYYNAGFVDMMYAVSITLMTLCLLSFNSYD